MIFFALGIVSGLVGFLVLSNWQWNFIFYIISAFFAICGIAELIQKAVNRLPLHTANARVFAKTRETSGGGTNYAGNGQLIHDSTITGHFVCFEFDGRRENFAVDVSVYNSIEKSDTGILEYRNLDGNLIFVNFTRQT